MNDTIIYLFGSVWPIRYFEQRLRASTTPARGFVNEKYTFR